MLVTYVLGDCPSCKQSNCFRNMDVYGDHVVQGCKHCRYSRGLALPRIKKKVVYLDQFFFSGAFRGGDPRFAQASEHIKKLAADQLLVAPILRFMRMRLTSGAITLTYSTRSLRTRAAARSSSQLTMSRKTTRTRVPRLASRPPEVTITTSACFTIVSFH